MENGKKFREMMTVISDRYEKKASQTFLNMTWAALKPYPDEECVKAFNYVFQRCRFYKDIIPDLLQFLDGRPDEDKALVEANNMISYLKEHGARVFPVISDPITKHLMTKRWPYRNWAEAILESEIKWWVKEFCEAYKTYSANDAHAEISVNEKFKQIVNTVGKTI